MIFEHLIEINHAEIPQANMLTREQLWAGLLLRAKEPKLFIPHLDGCEITSESGTGVSRILDFGKFKVKDRVTYVPKKKLKFFIPAQGEITTSRLEITIEEPAPEHFFLRFRYEDDSEDEGPTAMYNDFRRSAYKEADIDFVKAVRQFAMQGLLSSPAPDAVPQ